MDLIKLDSSKMKINYLHPNVKTHKFHKNMWTSFYIPNSSIWNLDHNIAGKVFDIDIPFTANGSSFILNLQMSNVFYGKAYPRKTGINCYNIFWVTNRLTQQPGKEPEWDYTPPSGCKADNHSYIKADYTYTIKNDKGENVYNKFPHNLIFSDIDSGRLEGGDSNNNYIGKNTLTPFLNKITEATAFNNGFKKLYLPKTYIMGTTRGGEKTSNPNTFYVNKKDWYSLDGDDSFLKGGVVAVPDENKTEGSFSIQTPDCGTSIRLATPINRAGIDKKLESNPNTKINETVTYKIEVPLPKKYENIFQPYTTMTIKDTLPDGMEIVKIDVNNPTINNPHLHYNKNSWQFTPDTKWLETQGTSGEKLTFTLTAKITNKTLTNETNQLINCATNTINTLNYTSCANPIIITKPNPTIRIEKYGDGTPATPTGTKLSGTTITFTYKITNTSKYEPVQINTVIDNKIGQINCPKQTLQPEETITCTKQGKI